jgi:hypothetical protein
LVLFGAGRRGRLRSQDDRSRYLRRLLSVML